MWCEGASTGGVQGGGAAQGARRRQAQRWRETLPAARLVPLVADSHMPLLPPLLHLPLCSILGGLLAAHDLSGDPALAVKAQDLADRLLPAFDSAPTGGWTVG